MGSKYLGRPAMQVVQQIGRMRTLYPNLPLTSWNSGLIRWSGALQPTDISDHYIVSIEYRLKERPRVFVLAPELRDHENGEEIPHLFPDGTLCLYLTNSGEWEPQLAIAETIVPWTSLWLYHYEVWHATGEWMGGGVHPRRRKRRR
jgi:hypothetical protein